jgi:hypothetical protein
MGRQGIRPKEVARVVIDAINDPKLEHLITSMSRKGSRISILCVIVILSSPSRVSL